MNITTYFLIPLVLFVILLYPLVRKAVALLEILVNKQVQQTTQEKQANTSSTSQTLFNLKLLAYERIILFIERIKPDSFIPRTLSPSLPYQEYQLLLINEIRKEFEYNLSQQLYLSENAWEVTVNIITLINSAATSCPPQATASDLARKILEHYISSDLKGDQISKIVKAEIQ